MSALPQAKRNITENIIVYPDGRCISLPPTDTKSEEPVTMNFDINTMPIVFEGIVMVENVDTLPVPAVEQLYTTNTSDVSNIVQPATKLLKLVTGESNLNTNNTALKIYSPKCKDAKLSVNTGKTYCSLRNSRSKVSNELIVIPAGSNTLLPNSSTSVIPAVKQSYTTNVPTIPNIAQHAIKPLKLVSGKWNLTPNKTALKTYSPKCKDAKLSMNTGKLSNKHTIIPSGSNTLLPNSSTCVIPSVSTCSRLSYENSFEPAIDRLVQVTSTRKDEHSCVQLNTPHGRAIASHSTLFNTKSKQTKTLQLKNPVIKTISTRKVSGNSCSLPPVVNLPTVSGALLKPRTVVITSKGEILPAPLQAFSKVIITKPHGTGVTSRSEGILPIPKISSKPISSSTTTEAAFASPVNAAPKSLNFLSMEDSIGSTVHIQKKFESPTTAKNVKPEQGNTMIPSRTIIIKGTKGQIVKKLIGDEKLIAVADVVLKKQVQEQLGTNKASGSFVGIKPEQETPTKSKLLPNKMVNKKMSSRDRTIAKPLALYNESSAKLLKVKTSGLTLNMSPGANSHLTHSSHPKRVPANSSIKEFANKTESVLPDREKGVILCDSFGNHTNLDEDQLETAPNRASDGGFELLTENGIDLIQSNDEILHFIDPNLVSNINNVMIPADDNAEFSNPTIIENASNQVNYNHSLYTEQAGNVFSRQPVRSQNILTTALADTGFLQDTSISSIDFNLPPLSPNGVLDSTNVVSALKSSIMTTNELLSTNTKIISDSETNILSTDVSEYVLIPITITHLKIVQSASQQHLLDTSDPDMPFSDTEPGGILFSSTQVSSPSPVSLPILDEDITQQQTYSSSPISMPSLNEDCSMSEIRKINDDCNSSTKNTVKTMDTDFSTIFNSSNHIDFGHLSPAGAEPPSDMFDSNMFDRYPMYPSVIELDTNIVGSSSVISPDDTISMVDSHSANINEDSHEIPAKPDIVTDLSSPYTTNSPFLTTYSSDQPMDFSKRYNEDESSDESPRKKHRHF